MVPIVKTSGPVSPILRWFLGAPSGNISLFVFISSRWWIHIPFEYSINYPYLMKMNLAWSNSDTKDFFTRFKEKWANLQLLYVFVTGVYSFSLLLCNHNISCYIHTYGYTFQRVLRYLNIHSYIYSDVLEAKILSMTVPFLNKWKQILTIKKIQIMTGRGLNWRISYLCLLTFLSGILFLFLLV